MRINIFWFRRDLRLEDNTALDHALMQGLPVLTVFIFDTEITDELVKDDPRIGFIYERLTIINERLAGIGSSVYIIKGKPETAWSELISKFRIESVYINRDYEPYAIARDAKIESLLRKHQIRFMSCKDQVIFEGDEILKADKRPYTVFTPYKNKWLQKLNGNIPAENGSNLLLSKSFLKCSFQFPSLTSFGFRNPAIGIKPFNLSVIPEYHIYRDYPAADLTSYLSPHLRFGTVSIREVVSKACRQNPIFLGELIWREFFMQILYHFPGIVTSNFKRVYDDIQWRNDEKEFKRWCNGETGYPIVDAGMRQLNQTGYMHNRVRMITAGFLCKHLLIDWRWGEAYFARKLLDYDLSSNNGNWQWAAGTGCDAAPYFRIFNPDTQQKKFDPREEYLRKWVRDFKKSGYPEKMVEHEFARKRAVEVYKAGIKPILKKF